MKKINSMREKYSLKTGCNIFYFLLATHNFSLGKQEKCQPKPLTVGEKIIKQYFSKNKMYGSLH